MEERVTIIIWPDPNKLMSVCQVSPPLQDTHTVCADELPLTGVGSCVCTGADPSRRHAGEAATPRHELYTSSVRAEDPRVSAHSLPIRYLHTRILIRYLQNNAAVERSL